MRRLIRTDDSRGLTTVALNRPEKHHAFDETMIAEMTRTLAEIADDGSVRAVVLTSSGPVFCAGGDLDWMRRQAKASRSDKMRQARALARMLKTLHDLPKPVICRVQGNAFGGGIGLMAAADVTVAADGAKFALTETRLGLIPATIGPFVAARIGSAVLRSVFVTGSVMDAARAERLGLVSLRAPAAELDRTVEREAAKALQAAPGAMARAKALAIDLASPDIGRQIEAAVVALADCWESDEARDGIAAFLARKPPPWTAT